MHEVLPQVPLLVIDDCSTDNTIFAARSAGAEILHMPHHLVLGGCVQAGYKIFFFQAEDGIRDVTVTGVQTCALPISGGYAVLGFDRLTWFRSGNNWIATRSTPWDSPVRCHRSVGRQPAVSTMGTGATKQRDG